MNTTKKIGIILANLGTPDAPQPAAKIGRAHV